MPREDLVDKAQGGQAQLEKQTLVETGPASVDSDAAQAVRQAAQEIEAAHFMSQTPAAAAPMPGDWAAYDLAEGYGITRAVLLVRDPAWLHCYWEIAAEARQDLRRETGKELWELPQIIRVYDVTANEICFDVRLNGDPRNWYIETNRPGHSFFVEIGVDLPGRGFLPIVRSNTVTAPIDSVSNLIDEEWMVVDEDFRRLYSMGAGLGPGRSSGELIESLSRRLARRMGSGAVSSLGSGFLQAGGQRHFWLVVGTELIVYGATQPDAKVSIDGRQIQLRPDGTFSARYALPDGDRAIPVTGIAADGLESITITPTVHKETH